jgi:hypothetical protein
MPERLPFRSVDYTDSGKECSMLRKNLATALLISASLVLSGNFATAQPGKEKNAGRGNAGQERGKGHKHAQKNGHNLLGAKLKQNGKHAIGKLANRDVIADVKDGKVANMSAGDLPVKRVRSKQKMAMIDNVVIPIAWSGPLQLAQYGGYSDYYYGYCFDDGYDFTCYWYPAEDVYYTEYTWDDYDPYY